MTHVRAAPRFAPRRAALAIVVGFGLAAAGALAPAATAGNATTHTVVIEGVGYEPQALTVRQGDTIVWINKDPFPHTVTAKGAFDSHTIVAGKSWRYVARKRGEYAYVCTLHPNMRATLTVR
jgi:plastocyanin